MGTGDTGVTIAVKTQLPAFQNDIGDVIRLFYGEGAAVEAEQTADMRLTHTHNEQDGMWTECIELTDGNGLAEKEMLSAPVACGGLEEKRQLTTLYKQLGERYKALDSWSAFIITSYEDAQKDMGIKATKNRKIYNGMIKTYVYQFMGPKPPKKGK